MNVHLQIGNVIILSVGPPFEQRTLGNLRPSGGQQKLSFICNKFDEDEKRGGTRHSNLGSRGNTFDINVNTTHRTHADQRQKREPPYNAGPKYWRRLQQHGPNPLTTPAQNIGGVQHKIGPPFNDVGVVFSLECRSRFVFVEVGRGPPKVAIRGT